MGNHLGAWRSLGGVPSQERLGVGFEKKGRGCRVTDELNRIYSYYALVYVIRGRGRYDLLDGRSYPIAAGNIIQRIPGIQHSTFVDEGSGWSECYLELGPKLYQALADMRVIRPDIFVYPMRGYPGVEDRFYGLLTDLELAGEEQVPDLVLRLQSLLFDLLSRAGMPGVTESERRMVEKACIHFGATLHQREDLKAFCASRGWGYEKFRKVFREQQGMSPGQYIIRRRMDNARQMLLTTDMQVGEIGYELGYAAAHEFSAQFKRHCGVSPSTYRSGR